MNITGRLPGIDHEELVVILTTLGHSRFREHYECFRSVLSFVSLGFSSQLLHLYIIAQHHHFPAGWEHCRPLQPFAAIYADIEGSGGNSPVYRWRRTGITFLPTAGSSCWPAVVLGSKHQKSRCWEDCRMIALRRYDFQSSQQRGLCYLLPKLTDGQ